MKRWARRLRRAVRRGLTSLLSAGDDWSHEFLEALDEEAEAVASRSGEVVAALWYVRQALSPSTVRFVLRMRARDRAGRRPRPFEGIAAAGHLALDLRHALRSLRRDPGLTAFICLTLAVGIGSVTSVYGVADRLFLSGPPHVADHEEVVRVYLEAPAETGRRTSPWLPWLTGRALQERVSGLSAVSLYRTAEELVRVGADTRPAPIAVTDLAYFGVLRPPARFGRLYGPSDGAGARVAVVSRGFAEARLGGPVAALGSSLDIGTSSYTVVGVTPAGFAGGSLDRIDVWVPLDPDEAGSRNWWVTARLAPGRSVESTREEAQTVHAAQDPGRFFGWAREAEIRLATLDVDLEGNRTVERAIAGLLLPVVLLVLLVAWVNVLNLLLARVTRRRTELSVRQALGAGRWRLTRQLLLENSALGLAGTALALPVAWGMSRIVRGVLLPDVAWTGAEIGWRTGSLAAGLGLASALVLALLVSLGMGDRSLSTTLKGTRQSASPSRLRLQRSLATAQVAMSAALLLSAALFVRSFRNLQTTELGMDADRVHAIDLRTLDLNAWPDENPDGVYVRALERMTETDPESRYAVSVGLPFSANFGMSIHVEGRDSVPALPGGGPFITMVSEGYFETVGTEILRGRAISREARMMQRREAVVGASTAAALWPAGNELGGCLRVGAEDSPCWTVVGVAEDVHRNGYREPPSLQVYGPIGAVDNFSGATLLARTRDGSPPGERVRSELVELDPIIDFVEIRRLDSFLAAEIRPWRLGATMLSLAGAIAVAIALSGVVAVLSYLVAQRRREIGIRLAIGATDQSIRRMIVRIGTVVGLVGVALGFALVLLSARWISPLLFEARVLDVEAMLIVGASLTATAALACLGPARRARRVDPIETLRSEG